MQNSFLRLRKLMDEIHPLTDEEFNKLAQHLFVKEVRPKELLINEQEKEENVYFVYEGMFRKFFRVEKDEIVTGFYKENSFMHAASSFYMGTPSLYVIEALEYSVVIGINKAALETLISEMCSLERVWRLTLSKMYVDKELNEYKRARYSKRELFLNFFNEEPELIRRVPQKYLASYLQIAPETYCRLKHIRYNEAKKLKQAS